MTFVRRWNFDVAARLLTTIDVDTLNDPDSDLGAAVNELLTSLSLAVSLPTGGATNTVLKKLSATDGDADWSAITVDDVTGLAAELAGLASQVDFDALSTTVAGKAAQSNLDALTVLVAGKASQAALDALSTTVADKASSASVAALTLGDLADVDGGVSPSDDFAVTWDATAGQYRPADLTGRFAEADPSSGNLLAAAAAPFTLFGFVIEEGAPVPTGLSEILGLGVPIIGFTKPAPPSYEPVLLASNFSQTANNVALTINEQLDVGDKLLLAFAYSAEATVPDHHSLAWSTGAATVNWTTKNVPNTTVATVMAELEITTMVPAGSTLTITNRTAAEAAVQRAHNIAMLVRTPNVAVAPAIDKTVAASTGSSSSNMSAIGTPSTSGSTSQPLEVALGVAAWNSGSGTTTRTLTGTNGWSKVLELESDNGSAGRSLALFWLPLSAIGTVQLTTLCTSSDGSTGQFSAQLATLKAA